MVGKVHGNSVETVRDRRTGRAPGFIVGPEHEVIDEELRTSSKEVRERGAPLLGFELVLLVDPDPRQLLPPPRQLVALTCEVLLRFEQLEPRCEPLFAGSGLVCRHRLLTRVSLVIPSPSPPSSRPLFPGSLGCPLPVAIRLRKLSLM